jgi:hypothetical protein
MNPYDKNKKTISQGDYVKFNNELWEVFDWKSIDELTGEETEFKFFDDYNDNIMIWLEPRAGNQFPAQWSFPEAIEVTDLQQLYFEL